MTSTTNPIRITMLKSFSIGEKALVWVIPLSKWPWKIDSRASHCPFSPHPPPHHHPKRKVVWTFKALDDPFVKQQMLAAITRLTIIGKRRCAEIKYSWDTLYLSIYMKPEKKSLFFRGHFYHIFSQIKLMQLIQKETNSSPLSVHLEIIEGCLPKLRSDPLSLTIDFYLRI